MDSTGTRTWKNAKLKQEIRRVGEILFKRLALTCVLALFSSSGSAQNASTPQSGTVERIKVHGRSLLDNLSQEPADRDVSVYLPPSYASSPNRRYPVIYLLHGFTDDDNKWFGRVKHFVNVPAVVDQSLAAAGAREVIVVMPNAFTKFFGSMYSTSATIGDWESFVAVDLVSAIDKQYRTVANAGSRGIAGHSMGGYGALRIAMKRPQTFSSVFALSPCCLQPSPTVDERAIKAEAIRTFEDLAAADFFTKATFASAAAWSPNPKRPPLFLDLLVQGGTVHLPTTAKWHANAILAIADQHMSGLRQLRGIALDAGDKDIPSIPPTARAFSELLATYGVEHMFDVYPGTHVSGVADRLHDVVLPFFWKRLDF